MSKALVITVACLLLPGALIAQEAPPRGTVVVGEDSLPMMWVASCWEGMCWDGIAIVTPWDSLDVTEFIAAPGSVVNLVYARAPERIMVSRKGDDSDPDSSSAVRLPKEPGVYDYMITAAWVEGDLVEGFRVRIKKP